MKTLQIIFLMVSGCFGVKIENIFLPDVVEEGENPVILECPFSFNDDEKLSLELNWFFGSSPEPFFKVSPGNVNNKPEIFGEIWQQKIDLNFSLNKGDDDHQKFQAVKIVDPDVSMSGRYRCRVSSDLSDDEAEADMMIYSPLDEMRFIQRTSTLSSLVNISCSVTGIFPLPQVKLTFGDYTLLHDQLEISVNNASYDVFITKMISREEMLTGRVFGCEASVPGTSYHVRQETTSCNCQTLEIKHRRRIWKKARKILLNNQSKL